MVNHQRSFWKPIVENMERGLEDRFSWEWFQAHPITRNLLAAEIRWGNTLEVACGLGVRTLILHEAKHCPVTGLDNDDFAIDYARKAASKRPGLDPEAVRFASGSFNNIPFPDASFDNVVLTAGIEHALYPVQVVDEIRRVTKNGGTLFLSVTENNFHADSSHLSSWNVATLTRLLSNYGVVRSWVDENIIFALLSFASIGEASTPRVVLCDLLTQDTYTPQWVTAFQRAADLKIVGLDEAGATASPKLVDSLKSACQQADILHLGTGANFSNIKDVLHEIRESAPYLLVSKWFGDLSDARYEKEVFAPSRLMDQVFIATSSYIGQIDQNCGQIFMNGTFEPRESKGWMPWHQRPVDIFVAANAYSEERLKRIRGYQPSNEFSWLWVGDGSPNGRLPRQSTMELFGLAKISLNVEDVRLRNFAHHISTRAYLATSHGNLVFSSRKKYLDSIFDGLVVQLDDDPAIWQRAYREWVYQIDDNALADLLWANLVQVYLYHTYDYKVYCILQHGGFAVARPEPVPPPVDFDKHKLLGERVITERHPQAFPIKALDRKGLKYKAAKEASPSIANSVSAPEGICLDLGCGAVKVEGFIGADRYALRGVDVILDLEAPLPFSTSSVDFLMASHSLEHVKDLMSVIREIYRVCKDSAQVCIVAPYENQSLNLANPYHFHAFNEHTPRFWTNVPWTPIDPAEYSHPHAQEWGLSESDSSAPGVDIRCLKLEFFYFPEYRQLSEEDQRLARKTYLDVCDQIVYHLVVVKHPMEEEEMQEVENQMDYYDPPYVIIRRLMDELTTKEELLAKKDEQIAQLEIAKEELLAKKDEQIAQLEITKEELLAKKDEQIAQLEISAVTLARELDTFRRSKTFRFIARFTNKNDLRDQISPAFLQFRDDSLMFNKGLKGFRLQTGFNLQEVPYVSYPLEVQRPNLRGILLAPAFDVLPSHGRIGIEIVSPMNEIVLETSIDAFEVDTSKPTSFKFPPIRNSDQGCFNLRVFVRDVDVPIRLFEWRKYRLWGLGPLQTRAFCGFVFDE